MPRVLALLAASAASLAPTAPRGPHNPPPLPPYYAPTQTFYGAAPPPPPTAPFAAWLPSNPRQTFGTAVVRGAGYYLGAVLMQRTLRLVGSIALFCTTLLLMGLFAVAEIIQHFFF